MTRLLLISLLALVFKSCICEDWCYQSQMSCEQPCKGPAAWNEVNAVCGGNKQSPINIVTKKTKKESSLTAFKFTGYRQPFTSTLKNNGQTVYLDIPSGATLSGGNLSNTYNAVQLKFHWGSSSSPGSEHTLDGEHYPMELHILHIKNKYLTVDEALNDVTGQAILGFFFEESATENTEYSTFIAAVTKVQDAESHTDLNISLNTLILSEMKLRDYYRYEGSQTIPGCSESVIWTMFKEPIPLSKAQLAAFFDLKSKDDWCYQSQMSCEQPCKGPAAWNEVNAVCGGNKQSPINIVTKKTKKESSLTAFKFTGYRQPFTSTLKNNGQTVYLDIPSGATLSGGNLSNTYNAVQLKFHWGSSSSPGSEHTLDGEHYPMELHILHIKNKYLTVDEALNDVTGQAILGFFFEESATENTEYSTFIAAVTKVQDAESHTDLNISLNTLILSEMKLRDYYRYEGSQTIPGCSESVIWTMFKEPIPLSKAQLAAFFDLKSKDGKPLVNTFRPVQPRKGRVVYRSHSGAAESVVVLSFTLILLSVSTTLSCNQLY
ncbi:hypothetical protein Q7C36_022584 [Tachysurus vachellii]|uniref:Carbonic anhydrase n=1 Tax=Tachysurus vachellii TaxID=175792 RepID=A0AA88LNM1_TACVA|nr:hypothetical protein Q7C36_022584 [Tachysurus vachellii]